MKRKRKIGIYGGSFNPIHLGHEMIASFVAQQCGLDEVWIMPSPRNPLKLQSRELANDVDRLNLAITASAKLPKVKVCDIEFSLAKPSFTYLTLQVLRQRYPEVDFSLIIGGDNWTIFHKWRNAVELLKDTGIIIYPRPGEIIDLYAPLEELGLLKDEIKGIQILEDAPRIFLSSSMIREFIKGGMNPVGFVSSEVADYIRQKELYK